ncbi:MAG: hypothetical protein KBC00_04320 [Candidatus Levybacteria bacterium]|nr:hypothetical protein [Candidatus Levybacteria bacterium]MBP9815520.1 hypothetical protein [Candidatus Levybacteria bacterium]
MKTITEWAIETILVIIHFPSNILFPFINFNGVNRKPKQKRPIILVERWFTRNPFHIFPKIYLEKKGFKVYSINSTLLKGTFDQAAEKLEKYIEKHRLEDVVLVGISAGATTCLTYLKKHRGWHTTHVFISIGGSIKGSPLSKIIPLPAVKELLPNSDFLKNLSAIPSEKLSKTVTLNAKHDNMVPMKYSTISGADNEVIDVVGHNLLHTFWIPTYRRVAEIAKRA